MGLGERAKAMSKPSLAGTIIHASRRVLLGMFIEFDRKGHGSSRLFVAPNAFVFLDPPLHCSKPLMSWRTLTRDLLGLSSYFALTN